MSLFDALLDEDLSSPPVIAREVCIALRTDGGAGATGTRDNPYDGSTATRFDTLMNNLSPNTTVHLGPGVFETEGGYGQASGNAPWRPKSGQAIIGAGMHATVLKLVRSNPDPDDAYGVVKVHPTLDKYLMGFLISDLTIDVNLQNQPNTTGNDFARVQCVAIQLVGRNLTVRRVRAINWGTRSESWEAFPIAVSAGAVLQTEADRPFNNIIEDCILELPIKENTRETTIVMFSGGENATAEEIFVQGCELRNCQVDNQFRNADLAPSMAVVAISRSGNDITVHTRWIHRLRVGDRVHIKGCSDSAYNDVYSVATVDANDPRVFTVSKPGLTGQPSGNDITALKVEKPSLRIKSLSYKGAPEDISQAVLETYSRHYRESDDWIVISGSSISALNGSFKVVSVDENDATPVFKMTIETGADGAGTASGDMWLDSYSSALISVKSMLWENPTFTIETPVPHNGYPGQYLRTRNIPATDGSKVAFAGYNKILKWLSPTKLELEPSNASDDPNLVYFSYFEDEFVVFGVMGHRLSDFVLWEQEAERALKMAYHEGCVIRNCLVDGGGLTKDVRGMSVSGGLGSILERNRLRNCRYGISIESVVSSPSPATYSNKDVVLWDNYINNVRHGIQVVTSSAHKVGRVIMERNTVLLANDGTPTGIEVKVTGTPEWAVEQCIVRHNVVRGASGVPDGTLGISLDYCQRAVVHNNVISVTLTDNAVRVRMRTGAKGTVFNNRTPSAGFLPVYDPETSRHLFEFTTDVEERLIAI